MQGIGGSSGMGALPKLLFLFYHQITNVSGEIRASGTEMNLLWAGDRGT